MTETNIIPEIKIVGPFASEYSLAKVNRDFACALDAITDKYKVSLFAEAGSVDKMPTKESFERYPKLGKLYRQQGGHARIAIYNNFPKSFPHSFELAKLDADIKLVYLAWEESVFPAKLVQEFNRELHGVLVASEHVRAVLRNSGVTIPIENISEGINQNLLASKPYKLKTNKQFKFLHVSSGLPRKGADVLIQAYLKEFKKSDDVALVIKTYRNEENKIPELLKKYHKPDSPEIEVIYDLELTEAEMASLYEQASAVVLPSRAEGFGLPMAEAMLKRVPVITTAYSGQMDFCTEENSWLLDYDLVKADSQLGLVNSYWAEPDNDDLREKMRFLFEQRTSEQVELKVEKAAETAATLTWEKTAERALRFLEQVEQFSKLKRERFAVISTYNSVCGIAQYSQDLYTLISGSFEDFKIFANTDAEITAKDGLELVRTWEYGEKDFAATVNSINEFKPTTVHIQYNSPFYSFYNLAELVEKLSAQKIKTMLTIHSLPDVDFADFRTKLHLAEKIIVHSERHKHELEKAGIENVELLVHGIKTYPDEPTVRLRKKLKLEQKPVIASHGLIHSGKGLLETLVAVDILKKDYPEILFLSVNAVNTDNSTSAHTFAEMKKYIREKKLAHNVTLIPDFLDKAEIEKLLHLADLIVLPYGELAEGASGAVRYALAANRPVVITNSAIFSDLGDAGYRIRDNKPETIATAVKTLLENKNIYQKQLERGKKFVEENSWEKRSNYVIM